MLRGLSVVHPVPSGITAVLVAVLAFVAGADPMAAAALAMAMLGYQFSIGTLNDIIDVEPDRVAKPSKPIPAGLVSRRVAVAIFVAGGAVGLLISSAFGAAVLVLGAAGYAAGLAYDAVVRPRGLGWLCFAAAFPLLLAWTWVAAAGVLPPGWPLLLPLAALAGPTIHLANSLVDADADARTGSTSLATQLGPTRAPRVLWLLLAAIYILAWATLFSTGAPPRPAVVAALGATIATILGATLSAHESRRAREAGWLLQAVAMATLAVGWLASVVET